MAQTLLSQFTTQIEGLTLIPSDGGLHEITVDGELIYSKLQTGRQPEVDQITELVRARLQS